MSVSAARPRRGIKGIASGTEVDFVSEVLLVELLGIEDLNFVLEVLREGEGEYLGVK